MTEFDESLPQPSPDNDAASLFVRLAKEAAGENGKPAEEPQTVAQPAPAAEPRLNFEGLVGYDDAIASARSLGIGRSDDPEFAELLALLNQRHGLSEPPAMDSLVVRAEAREDAARFAQAVAGECNAPTVRMRLEENAQGFTVLCLSIQGAGEVNAASLSSVLDKGGALVLEDIDLWEPPYEDSFEDLGGLIRATVGRGAREAMGLIRAAVEHPSVMVVATACPESSIDAFFAELLAPFTVLDIQLPSDKERDDLWAQIARDHPSLRTIDRGALVRLSKGMPRYDIYMAAREAVEEAYKEGVAKGQFVPVSAENLFDKLAAYQPLGSQEYLELEESVVASFRQDLGRLEEFLGGE